MIMQEFDRKTVAKMDLALERACRYLPDHDARRFVATRIIACARTHTQTLAGLTGAGRQAVADLTERPAATVQSRAALTGQ
jgi:hypothetical protein